MKTFLFAWNPNKWNWTTLEQSIDQIEQTGRASKKWSVVSHKKIQLGDRAFLIRLGKEPKGITPHKNAIILPKRFGLILSRTPNLM